MPEAYEPYAESLLESNNFIERIVVAMCAENSKFADKVTLTLSLKSDDVAKLSSKMSALELDECVKCRMLSNDDSINY